jgi:hypothetical protein
MAKKNQADHVREETGFVPVSVTERIVIPGLQTLHNKTADEIGQALGLILKSRSNITEIRYKIGEFIELTSTQTTP